MKGTNEINPEFNGNGKAVALLEKPIDDNTQAKMVPVIPAPETEISAPAEVKTGADCNRRKLRAKKLKSVDRSMMLLKLRSGNRKPRLKTLNCNFPTGILLLRPPDKSAANRLKSGSGCSRELG